MAMDIPWQSQHHFHGSQTTAEPVALYLPTVRDAAYQLRYSWMGWPSCGSWIEPPISLIEQTRPLWERDRLRVMEYRWLPDCVQILFSATPDIAPVFIAQRAKGRLDHALREAGVQAPFSRKVAVRAVGNSTRRDVEAYLARQVPKERFADPVFAQRMSELTVINTSVDLSQPTESVRGRYWYNLHLVLVAAQQATLRSFAVLAGIRDMFLRIADSKGHAVSRLAVMPDHVHAALRAPPDVCPLQLVYSYQNNLAYLLQLGRVWRPGFYVGTFGEYSTQAVRNNAAAR